MVDEQSPVAKSPKGTKAQVNKRVNTVHKLLVMGKDRAYILQYASDHMWSIGERQIDTYIARANDTIAKQAKLTRDEHHAQALQRLDLVFSEALDNDSYKDALGAQHQINNLMGLYAPKKLEHSGEVALKGYTSVSPDDWSDKP